MDPVNIKGPHLGNGGPASFPGEVDPKTGSSMAKPAGTPTQDAVKPRCPERRKVGIPNGARSGPRGLNKGPKSVEDSPPPIPFRGGTGGEISCTPAIPVTTDITRYERGKPLRDYVSDVIGMVGLRGIIVMEARSFMEGHGEGSTFVSLA